MGFLEMLFGKEEAVVSEAPQWEPVQINEVSGVSVTWEKNDGSVVQMTCTGVFESLTRFMLVWKDDENKKIFIGKEDIISIEVQ